MAIDINSRLQALTPQHQQLILDFIEFLAAQEISGYSSLSPNAHPLPTANWQTDDFFGIWRDRPDLQDSTTWVKQVRQQQWTR